MKTAFKNIFFQNNKPVNLQLYFCMMMAIIYMSDLMREGSI